MRSCCLARVRKQRPGRCDTPQSVSMTGTGPPVPLSVNPSVSQSVNPSVSPLTRQSDSRPRHAARHTAYEQSRGAVTGHGRRQGRTPRGTPSAGCDTSADIRTSTSITPHSIHIYAPLSHTPWIHTPTHTSVRAQCTAWLTSTTGGRWARPFLRRRGQGGAMIICRVPCRAVPGQNGAATHRPRRL